MKNAIGVLFCILFCVTEVQTQNSFQRMYRTSANEVHSNHEIVADNWGISYVAMSAESITDISDISVIKLDANGDTLWSRAYYSSIPTEFGGMTLAPSRGVVLTGCIYSYPPNNFMNTIVMEIDPAGNIVWKTEFEVLGDGKGLSVSRAPGGGYYVFGICNNGFSSFVARINSVGSLIWSQLCNSSGAQYDDEGKIITCLNNDIACIVEAYDTTTAEKKTCIMRMDSAGNFIWQKLYAEGNCFIGKAIAESATGDLVFAVRDDYNSSQNTCMTVVRMTSAGGILWAKLLVYSNAYDFHPNEICVTTSDEIVVGGTIYVPSMGQQRGYISRMTANGAVISTKTYDPLFRTTIEDLALAPAGGFIAAGSMDSLMSSPTYVLRTDLQGNATCGMTSFNFLAYNQSVQTTSPSPSVFIGSSLEYHTISSMVRAVGYWYDCPVAAPESAATISRVYFDGYSIHFENCESQEFTLYDVHGRMVRRCMIPSSYFEMTFDVYAEGIYSYTLLESDGTASTGKIIKHR